MPNFQLQLNGSVAQVMQNVKVENIHFNYPMESY